MMWTILDGIKCFMFVFCLVSLIKFTYVLFHDENMSIEKVGITGLKEERIE